MRRMYEETKTWNPHVGCRFNCIYCKPSFQRLMRFQKCADCKSYSPHAHEERLSKIPNSKNIFVCGTGDLAFVPPEYLDRIIGAVRDHALSHPGTSYYFQSKHPGDVFPRLIASLKGLEERAILLTTLETNRDHGYDQISAAPPPSIRARDFRAVFWKRKIITIEPVIDFDLMPFLHMILPVWPEAIYIGYNSKPNQVSLPEPSYDVMHALIRALSLAGIEVRRKDLRGGIGERAHCPGCGRSLEGITRSPSGKACYECWYEETVEQEDPRC